MKRKDFFKKTIFGLFAVWSAPEILVKKKQKSVVPDSAHWTKGQEKYLVQNQKKGMEKAIRGSKMAERYEKAYRKVHYDFEYYAWFGKFPKNNPFR